MTMPIPIIIINLKTYERGSDVNAEMLVRELQKASTKYKAGIAIAAQAADLFRLTQDTTLPLFAQHVDPESYGAHTGATLIETVRCNGAIGTLLNHSERRVPFEHVKETVEEAKRMGFVTVVCAKDSKEAGKIAQLSPDFIAVEPPELIGGDVSVSRAKPEVIKDSVKAVGSKSKLLVGAGVKTGEDVRIALKLGAQGVLVASGVVQAKDPKKALLDLLEGTKKK